MKNICIWSKPPMSIPNLNTSLLLFFFFLISSSLFAQRPRPRQLRVNNRGFQHIPRTPAPVGPSQACDRAPYRSIDGTCNNISQSDRIEWGASDIELHRKMEAAYGQPDEWNDMAGQNRPSPRAISNAVGAQSEDLPSAEGLSSLVFSWGQFIDHDIDLTPEEEDEYHPIILPDDEPLFNQDIPFFRSAIHEGTGVRNDRQQTNLITSWLDASMVYGSEETRAAWLRTFSDGKLKTSSGNMLPYNTIDGNFDSPIDPDAPSMAGDGEGTHVVFVVGDVRANEQAGLTSLHTLFVREHNRVCNQLRARGIRGDEELYQRARKQIGAYIQHITYTQFLPALGIRLAPYRGYRADVQPDIANIFTSAAYRLGHTMVTEEILLRDNSCEEVGPGSLSLLEAFFNNEPIQTYGIGPILKGLSVQTQQEVDLKIIDNLRNFLFGDPNTPVVFGLDLASLNIQRGRDHGLPSYNEVREHYIGSRARNFNQINPDAQIIEALRTAYDGQVDRIDLWVGLLAERHLPGSSIGPTLHAVLSTQFESLRDGDFYYYQNDPMLQRRELDDIRRTTLTDIIRRNTEMTRLATNVFYANPCANSNAANNRISSEEETSPAIEDLEIFPNPTNGMVNIQFGTPKDSQIKLDIRDLAGRSILKQELSKSGTYYRQQLDLSYLSSGLYFVIIRNADRTQVRKLMIE